MSDGTSSDRRIVDIVVPRLGETMEEGVVRDWLKSVGDSFERGDPIVEVETDKTIAEVPALAAGTLIEILADSGETLAVGAPLGRIEIAVGDAPAPQIKPARADASPAPAAGPTATSTAPRDGEPLRATPAARRAARERGIELASLKGSGRLGRIERTDVEGAGETVDAAFDLDGPDDGAPVLLLHGFAADRTAWAALRQGLKRAGFRVLTPDLPGHGASTHDASSPDALAEGLAALVRARFGDTAPHVIAHSLGTAAAVVLQRRLPIASLTLIAPAGVGRSIDADFVRGIASPDSPEHVRALLKRLTSATMPFSDTAIATLYTLLSQGRLMALADSLLDGAAQAVDLVPAIVAVADTVPVRIVIGHRDTILDWRAACALSPRIAVHHLPDAGHVPHWDAPRDVQTIVLDALRERRAMR